MAHLLHLSALFPLLGYGPLEGTENTVLISSGCCASSYAIMNFSGS